MAPSILSQVKQTSMAATGIRVVIAGVEKVGKTTLACSAPRPLLIPLEQGYMGINVNMTPRPASFQEVLALLDEIIAACQKGQFIYKSLVFDSGTALERLIHDVIIETDAA